MRTRHRITITLLALLALVAGCDWDGVDRNPRPNEQPTVEITGGATEGRDADYRVEFFWFGSDPDGTVDHFVYAIDDTCLCVIADSTEIENPDTGESVWIPTPRKSLSLEDCLASGAELLYEHPDSIWQRIELFSGSFAFQATEEHLSDPSLNTDEHTFFVKAVDDAGLASRADYRSFNATTVVPTSKILRPVGGGDDKSSTVSTFVAVSWSGRDEDSVRPDKKPIGYQMKLVEIGEQPELDEIVLNYLTHSLPGDTSSVRRTNRLIPDSLWVYDAEELPDETFYHRTDWWPKADEPYEFERIQLRNLPRANYAFAVRAVDQAGAITPDRELVIADLSNDGNVIKLDVNPSITVNPHIEVTEFNLLGRMDPFTAAAGQVQEFEVPANVQLRFEWSSDATWYGAENGLMNFALDIPDPACEVCQSSDGVGGWIGWGNTNTFSYSFPVSEAGREHILYIRARDEGNSPEREILAVIVLKVVAFSFDKTALWVDDFTVSGLNDCRHDAIIEPMLEYAIADHLELGEELEVFEARSTVGCGETSLKDVELSMLSRYNLIYWNVAGSSTALGTVTSFADRGREDDAETNKYLSIYVRAGGNVIVWGRNTIGALLGDFRPSNEPYWPELDLFNDPNFGPDTFLWDVMRFRTSLDRTERGTVLNLKAACSGVIGLEATERAISLGFPAGGIEPTGYSTSRTAIWKDSYAGVQNNLGGLGMAFLGSPALRVAGMDTLYTNITNSWAWERVPHPTIVDSFENRVREVCGAPTGSPLNRRPVVVRYKNPTGAEGHVVWVGTELHQFNDRHQDDLWELMKGATDWVFGAETPPAPR